MLYLKKVTAFVDACFLLSIWRNCRYNAHLLLIAYCHDTLYNWLIINGIIKMSLMNSFIYLRFERKYILVLDM